MPQHNIERRYFKAKECKVELRADANGRTTCRGYAAVFNSMSEDLGWCREVIEQGAFTEALQDPDLDTCALFNHNPDMILARYPQTLRMQQDGNGLYCEMDLADTQCARDLIANINAGNVYQMSFAFTINDAEMKMVNGENVRYISSIGKLFDVSPVTYPAYKQTSISARAKQVADIVARADNKEPITAQDIEMARAMLRSLESAIANETITPEASVEICRLRNSIMMLKAPRA